MCGICGFLGEGDSDILQRMTDSLTHRGPDIGNIWSDPSQGIYLGHRRLVILDEAGGSQPMHLSHRYSLVFNGEIYNHTILREELIQQGHHFQSSRSDTEVLLHAYAEWGCGMPAHLDGMWAFAIYDHKTESLFCSRDPFGKKPFYYSFTRRTFLFASELTTLFHHPLSPRSESVEAIVKFFAHGYIPSPLSAVQGVWKLPAGCNLLLRKGASPEVNAFWKFRVRPRPDRYQNKDEVAEEFSTRLSSAVKKRLQADVSVGLFLSGGLDSSSIACLAAQAYSNERIQTFSVGFYEKSFDESGYAQQVADQFGTQHHRFTFSLKEARQRLPDLLQRMDEPLGDPSLLPASLLCQETAKHVKVALSGDGGDELLAGYDPFAALRIARLYQKMIPRALHPAIAGLVGTLPVSHRNMSLDFKIKRALRGVEQEAKFWYPLWMSPLSIPDLGHLTGKRIDPESVFSEAIEAWEDGDGLDDVTRLSQCFTRIYLQDDILTKTDRASMHHGLEVRCPFLDKNLATFIQELPAQFKLCGSERKVVLRRAMRDRLPKEILKRPKKGFGIPIGSWFQQKELTPFLPAKSPFQTDFMKNRLLAHQNNQIDDRAFLWNCLVYGHWSHANLLP